VRARAAGLRGVARHRPTVTWAEKRLRADACIAWKAPTQMACLREIRIDPPL
jgi:hypothetical protein